MTDATRPLLSVTLDLAAIIALAMLIYNAAALVATATPIRPPRRKARQPMNNDHEGFAGAIRALAVKLIAISDMAPKTVDETDIDSLDTAQRRVDDVCHEIDKCFGELAVQCGLMQHDHDSVMHDGSELAWEIRKAVQKLEAEAPSPRSDYEEHGLGARQLGVGAR